MLKEDEKYELLELIREKLYQNFHPKVIDELNKLDVKVKHKVLHTNTFDTERERFITHSVNFLGRKILDIGANTGFFSFSSIFNGAKTVTSFESEKINARLIELQSKLLNLENKIVVKNHPFDFKNDINNYYDVIICLNVLHHSGRYFDREVKTESEAKENIIKYLNNFSNYSNYCIFQIGYNWKGEEDKPLFKNGTKIEQIDFIKENTNEFWEIENVGIAEIFEKKIFYNSPNSKNLARIDKLGEFLNRPLFILKSKRTS